MILRETDRVLRLLVAHLHRRVISRNHRVRGHCLVSLVSHLEDQLQMEIRRIPTHRHPQRMVQPGGEGQMIHYPQRRISISLHGAVKIRVFLFLFLFCWFVFENLCGWIPFGNMIIIVLCVCWVFLSFPLYAFEHISVIEYSIASYIRKRGSLHKPAIP